MASIACPHCGDIQTDLGDAFCAACGESLEGGEVVVAAAGSSSAAGLGPPPVALKRIASFAIVYALASLALLIWVAVVLGANVVPVLGVVVDSLPKVVLLLSAFGMLAGSRVAMNVFSLMLILKMIKPFVLVALIAFVDVPDWLLQARGQILIPSFIHAGLALVISYFLSSSKSIEQYFGPRDNGDA